MMFLLLGIIRQEYLAMCGFQDVIFLGEKVDIPFAAMAKDSVVLPFLT